MQAMRALRELAKRYGIQSAYEDVTGGRRNATAEALLRTLRILGARLDRPEDAAAALHESDRRDAIESVEPVHVAWNGALQQVAIRFCGDRPVHEVRAELHREDGERLTWRWTADQLASAVDQASPESITCRLTLGLRLPLGYHRLTIQVGDRQRDALVIAAPGRLKSGALVTEERQWGLFAPLYALRADSDWGAGSVRELGGLSEWLRELGGTLVASLPMLASFHDQPGDLSPYSPASRLFWNEFFIDATRAEEFADCPAARQLVGSVDFQHEMARLRAAPLVDALPLMRLKRRVLELLAARFFSHSTPRREAYEQHRQSSDDWEPYARFRAACERLGRPWTQWPAAWRAGELPDDPLDEPSRQYHRYAQWLAHEQLDELSRHARAAGMVWYLDLPLGSHPDGYDVWRYRDAFAMGASGGAPPDAFFTKGQNWGFPPLHPRRLRERHYDYFIRVLRHHLRQARLLRIDHVMGLHRLYWIPDGLPASQGVYVRYPADELYAILLLEAHRLGASIIGENLGTVPKYVDQSMRRHGLGRLYVLQFAMAAAASDTPVSLPDRDEVASLNTHDMPPFASWWQGLDIADRVELGLISPTEAAAEQDARERLRAGVIRQLRAAGVLETDQPDLPAILQACLRWLARSPARVMLVNLEDLWLETRPQNTPGTVTERANWSHKAGWTLEQIRASSALAELLREINALRRLEQQPRKTL